jgi:hypothetical protein
MSNPKLNLYIHVKTSKYLVVTDWDRGVQARCIPEPVQIVHWDGVAVEVFKARARGFSVKLVLPRVTRFLGYYEVNVSVCSTPALQGSTLFHTSSIVIDRYSNFGNTYLSKENYTIERWRARAHASLAVQWRCLSIGLITGRLARSPD